MTLTAAPSARAPSARRGELASFLRSRRARLSPADVGFAPGPRRRTPGLRREELAQLAGVGVTWYTWLEQGRPINASVQVLDAIARTLRLDEAERLHLYHLADVPLDPPPTLVSVLPATARIILDGMPGLPAVIFNARYDVLAYNAALGALFPFVLAGGGRRVNVLWHLFTAESCRATFVNAHEELPQMVATLRAAFGRHVGEPGWTEFVRALSAASPTFARMWASHDVAAPGSRTKVLRHRAVGELTMVTASYEVSGAPEARMVVYTPADATARERLDELLRPGPEFRLKN